MSSSINRPSHEEHAPKVSVIIPTFRDWGRLAKCLEAIEVQSYPGHLLEVIVVNNDPADPPPSSLPFGGELKLLTEAAPGSYAARNKGIDAAAGQILAFTDSDCVPDRRWIAAAVDELQSGAERVAGRIQLFSETVPPTLADEYEKLIGFNQDAYASSGTAVTANMITWRQSFDTVGRFDSTLLSGGDMEWGFRAQRHGLGIRYVSECIVRHPTRGTLGALFEKARRVSGGVSAVPELRGGRLWWLRAVMPPKSVRTIAQARQLSLLLRLRIIGVAYALKLWHFWNVLLLHARVRSPERR